MLDQPPIIVVEPGESVTQIMQQEFLSRSDLTRLGIPKSWSNRQLRHMEATKKFPKRLHLSPRRVAWLRDEVIGWMAAKRNRAEWKPTTAAGGKEQ